MQVTAQNDLDQPLTMKAVIGASIVGDSGKSSSECVSKTGLHPYARGISQIASFSTPPSFASDRSLTMHNKHVFFIHYSDA